MLIRAGWGEVCKSLVIVLLLAGEEKFERSRVVLEKSVVLLGDLCVAFGVGFGVDAWSGRGGLLVHVLLVSLLPSSRDVSKSNCSYRLTVHPLTSSRLSSA